MDAYKTDIRAEIPVLGIPQGSQKFSEKEVLAAIIAVEDILNMEILMNI